MTDLTDPALPEAAHAVATPPYGAAVAPHAPVPDHQAIPIAKTTERPVATAYAPSWPKIVHTLTHPIIAAEGATPITEISIPEPDLETMERVLEATEALGITGQDEFALSVKHLRPLLVAFTGLPDATLRRLHFKDVRALSEKMVPLLEGLTT